MSLHRKSHVFTILMSYIFIALTLIEAQSDGTFNIVTEIGGEAIFNCSTRTSHRMCSLMAGPGTVASDDRTVQTDLRFKIIDKHNCIIQASNLQVDDSGTYICYSSVPQIKLVVGRRPNDPILRHNGAEVENNTDHILVTDSGIDAYITCESSEGVPNPTFEWFVDGYPTTDSVTSDYIESESLSKSTLKFPFNDHDKREKLIACYVIHPLYRGETVFVSARVGEAVSDFNSSDGESCTSIDFVNRGRWGVTSKPSGRNQSLPVEIVFFHHTAPVQCNNFLSCSKRVLNMYKYQLKLGKSDIGYNFLIGKDGSVFIGRGWDKVGDHTKGHNAGSIGIAFIGDFTNNQPDVKFITAAKKLLACGVQRGKLAFDYGLYGERDGNCASGPGNAFYNMLPNWPNWHAKGLLKYVC